MRDSDWFTLWLRQSPLAGAVGVARDSCCFTFALDRPRIAHTQQSPQSQISNRTHYTPVGGIAHCQNSSRAPASNLDSLASSTCTSRPRQTNLRVLSCGAEPRRTAARPPLTLTASRALIDRLPHVSTTPRPRGTSSRRPPPAAPAGASHGPACTQCSVDAAPHIMMN
jgi:hypothetical protein